MTTLVEVPKDGTALDVLAERYRVAFDKVQAGCAQWIEGTLDFSIVALEARARYPSDQALNRWITRNQLEHLHPSEFAAYVGIGRIAQKNIATARNLLEKNIGRAIRTIWEKKAKTPVPPNREPTPRPVSRKTQRAARIPTVMQDNPPPERKGVDLKGLTREQVDPNFKGTPLEFATKHGHVNLHTKEQIERNKCQDALMAWLGALTDHARTASALTALAPVDPDALREWMTKPAKAGKLQAWFNSVQLAYESLRDTVPATSAETK